VIGIALNRSRRSFSDRDRTVLELLRPHLAQAYAHVQDRVLAWGLVQALESGLEEGGGAIAMLDGRHRIVHSGEPAGELLAAYFGSPARGDRAMLPARVRAWLEQATASDQPMVVQAGRGQLTLRCLAAPSAPGGWLLALNERRAHPPTVATLQESFGLARRQAEVLRLACTGRGNDEISRELRMARATVRKHLEQVYSRMGVDSRTAAVARALGVGR
jgi:DNA-binding CsgD family transcriptional regulator